MKIFLFLAFICLCLSQAGFKATLSKRGIDYARDIGMTVLQRELRNLKIPDQNGDVGSPIGKIDWWLNNLAITGINLPSPSFNIIENSHLQLLVNGITISLNFNWRFKQRSFPRISDSGSGTVSVTDTRLHADIILTPQNGKIHAQVRGINFGIGGFNIRLRGGASWLYNIIIGLFRGRIKGEIEKAVRNAVVKEVHGRLNDELSKIPYTVELKPTGVGLDYSMTTNPTYAPSYLTLPLRGEFYDFQRRQRSDHSPIQFPDYLGENKMLHLILSDFVIKTAGEAFHKKGLAKVWITDKMIPSWSPVRLNSSSLSLMIPNLQRAFPNKELRIHLMTTSNPHFDIKEQNATARIFGDIQFFAVENNELKPAFTLGGVVLTSGKAGLNGNNVNGELFFVSQKFAIKETHIGDFNVQMFDDLMNMFFARGIIPMLNVVLKEGFTLPTLRELDLINPEIKWGNSFLSISTDVRYKL